MKTGRKSAPQVTAIVAGEPTTIKAGDEVTIAWTQYGRKPAGTTHVEGASDRHPTRKFWVKMVDKDYRNGPAIRLDGQQNVKPTNRDAVIDEVTGEVIGRWLPLYRKDGTPTTQVVSVSASLVVTT